MHDATHDMPHHCRGATASNTADRRRGGGGCSARTQRHACARATCGSAGSPCVGTAAHVCAGTGLTSPTSAPGLSCLCTRRQVGATHPADIPCEWPVGLKFGQYALQQCNDLSERSPQLVILHGCDWLGHLSGSSCRYFFSLMGNDLLADQLNVCNDWGLDSYAPAAS